jgi:hypothetical protein
MNRSEICERIGLTLKRCGVNPIARNSITKLVMEEFKDILNESLDSEMEATLLVLHDVFGFGKKRIEQFAGAMQEMLDNGYDTYGIDALIKFQMMLKERGINFRTTLDDRKEKKNGKQ